MKTHEQYLEDLKNKNIDVEPLELYSGANNKILHKCTCGNKWMVTPSKVLNNRKCGCKNNKKTHNVYLKDLKNKNIDVIPLEKYNGIDTKILHKCTCGNEWAVSPNTVLKGYKCGCKNHLNKTHEEYIKQLLDKKIYTIPLEEYKNNTTKILHRCTCGNEWMATPATVLYGFKCGCMLNKKISSETYKNRKTILYYIKVNELYKIGISLFERYNSPESQILKGRYGDKKYKDYNIKILQYKIYDDGSEAFMKEKEILEEYDNKKYMYISDDMNEFGGYTELFKEDLDIII